MKGVLRYRQPKPLNGHFSFQLHGGAEVMGYQEYWRDEGGWEVVLDVLCDTSEPVEKRSFFICGGGDNLDFLGDDASAYHVATHYAKNSYAVYVFDTSHVSDTMIQEAVEANKKVYRPKPDEEERGGKRKWREQQAERRKAAPPRPVGKDPKYAKFGPGRPSIYRFHDKTPECEGIFQIRGPLPDHCLGCGKPNLQVVSHAS